jgi:hypothetical protein
MASRDHESFSVGRNSVIVVEPSDFPGGDLLQRRVGEVHFEEPTASVDE